MTAVSHGLVMWKEVAKYGLKIRSESILYINFQGTMNLQKRQDERLMYVIYV